MKYFSTLLAATAALGLASLAWGAGPQEQSMQAEQAARAQSQSMPQADQPTTQSTPSQEGPSSPSTHLAALVPAGMSAEEACTGFKSVKDCAASLHASQNLNIPFADLKSKVTSGQGLGAAIHALKPDANARAEVKKAEGQARDDVHGPRG
jgi:hypothetical protein